MLRSAGFDQDEAPAWSDPTVSLTHPSAVGRESDGVLQEACANRESPSYEVYDTDRDVDEGIRGDSDEFN